MLKEIQLYMMKIVLRIALCFCIAVFGLGDLSAGSCAFELLSTNTENRTYKFELQVFDETVPLPEPIWSINGEEKAAGDRLYYVFFTAGTYEICASISQGFQCTEEEVNCITLEFSENWQEFPEEYPNFNFFFHPIDNFTLDGDVPADFFSWEILNSNSNWWNECEDFSTELIVTYYSEVIQDFIVFDYQISSESECSCLSIFTEASTGPFYAQISTNVLLGQQSWSWIVYDSLGNESTYESTEESMHFDLCAGTYEVCTFIDTEPCVYHECTNIEVPSFKLSVQEVNDEWIAEIVNPPAVYDAEPGFYELSWYLDGNGITAIGNYFYIGEEGDWAFDRTAVDFLNINDDEIHTICLQYNVYGCSGEVCSEIQFLCQPEVYLNTIDDVHYFTHSQDWAGTYQWEIDGVDAGNSEVLELPVSSVSGSTKICVFYEAYGDEESYKCSSQGCFFFNSCDLFSIDVVEVSDGNYISFQSLTSQTSVSYAINDIEVGPIDMPYGSVQYHVSPGIYNVCAVFEDSISVSPSCEVEICEDLVIYGDCNNVSLSHSLSGSMITVSAYVNWSVPWEEYPYFHWFIDGQDLELPSYDNMLQYELINPFGNKEVCVLMESWLCDKFACTTINFPCPPECGEAQIIQTINENLLHLEIDFSGLGCPYEEEAEWWINGEYLGLASEIDFIIPTASAIEVHVRYFAEFNCEHDLYETIIYTEDEECFRGISYQFCGSILEFQVEGEFDETYELTWTLDGELIGNNWEASQFIDEGIYELCLQIHAGTCYFQECITIGEPVETPCDLYIEIEKSEVVVVFSFHSASDSEFTESADWFLEGDFIGNGNSVEYEMEEDGGYRICAEFPSELMECSGVCFCEYFIVDLGCDFELNHWQFWGLNTFEITGPSGSNVSWTIDGESVGFGPDFETSFQEMGEYEVCASIACSLYERCETIVVEEFSACDFSISSYQEDDLLMHFSANSISFPFEAGFSTWTINGEVEGWGYQFSHEFEEFGSYEICFNYEGVESCNFQQCDSYLIEELGASQDCFVHVFVQQLGLGVELSFMTSGNLVETNWFINGSPWPNSQTTYTANQTGLYQACAQTEDANGCVAESCVTYEVFAPMDYCDVTINYQGEELAYEFWAEVPGSLGDVEFVWLNGFFEEIGNADTIEYIFPQTGSQIICVEYYDENPLCASSLHCENIFIQFECAYYLEYTITGNIALIEVVETSQGVIEDIDWTFNLTPVAGLTENSFQFYFESGATYDITIEIQGNNGCHSIEEIAFAQSSCEFEIIWEDNGNQHTFNLQQENSVQLIQSEWSIDGVSVSDETSLALNIAEIGTYEICAEIETVSGCQFTQCIEIEIVDQLVDDFCPTTPSVMVEDNGTIYLSANYLPTNDLQVYWDYGSGAILNGDTHVLTDLAPGNYGFCFIYFSPTCNNTQCVEVEIEDPLCLFEIEFESDLLNFYFEAEGYAGENYEIEWAIDDSLLIGSAVDYVFSDYGQWLICATAIDVEGNECEHCRFVLVEDPSGDNCSVYFDYLLDENTLLVGAHSLGVLAEDLVFNWDFGNGESSMGQNATHSYSEAGEYLVCVELETELESCFDTACRSITVESLVFNLNGNVTTGDLQDDDLLEAVVWLYQYDDEQETYSLLDTSHTQSTQFEFSELNRDFEYILHAVLKENSPLNQNHTPTYFNAALDWQSAEHIDYTNSEITIQLEKLQPLPGDGFIEGQISNQVAGEDLEGALIFLTDAEGNAVAYTYADEFGYFYFDDLPEGSYLVFSEFINIESDLVLIKIKPENLTQHYIDFIFTGQRIEGSTSTGLNEEARPWSIDLYPNPFDDILTIESPAENGQVDLLQIFDLSGKIIYSHKVTDASQLWKLDTSDWYSGVYLLRILGDRSIRKKILKN